MDKNEKKALLQAWKAKQNKAYILNKSNAKSLFGYIEKCLDKAPCNHTLCHTMKWLRKKYPTEDEIVNQILSEIQEDGGYCDCEVVLNCYEHYESA